MPNSHLSIEGSLDSFTPHPFHPVYAVAAGAPRDTDIDQTYPDDLESALCSNPAASWWIFATDNRWLRFDVHAGQVVMIDTDACPTPGDVVAAIFPGDSEPDLYDFHGTLLGNSNGELVAVHYATTDAPVILGVAERKVTIEKMRRGRAA